VDGFANYCETKVRFGAGATGIGYPRCLLLKAKRIAVTNLESSPFPLSRKPPKMAGRRIPIPCCFSFAVPVRSSREPSFPQNSEPKLPAWGSLKTLVN
jgi:hypothetical protein